MSGHAGPWSSSEQPGLEVNHQPGLEVDTRYPPADGPEGLQVVSQTGEPAPLGSYYVGQELSSSEVNSTVASKYDGQLYQGGPTETAETATPPATPLKRNKKVLWVVAGAIAVLVILGAVLGGVLGSRAASSHSNSDSQDGSSQTTNNDTTTNATSLHNIRSGSRLAVTGWRDGSNYRIRLFYQGPDQKLRSSSYASNESAWSDPITLSGVEYAASNDTMLGASVSVEAATKQYKLYYVDQNSVLRGQGYNDLPDAAAQGAALVLNDYPITIPSTSRIAAYWPYIMTQNSDGHLQLTYYYGSSSTDNWWENSTLSLIGSSGAGMVALPASQWYKGAGGIVYRRNDGKMITYLANNDNDESGTAWGTADLSMTIPSSSVLGGFAVGRPNNSDNQTNTYLLYQDNSGTIQVVWQDDTSGWKGPSTYDAFDDADNGTDIACLTPAAWNAASVTVTSNQDMNRCYFQVQNQVREVYFDGSNWNDEGYLPIT